MFYSTNTDRCPGLPTGFVIVSVIIISLQDRYLKQIEHFLSVVRKVNRSQSRSEAEVQSHFEDVG